MPRVKISSMLSHFVSRETSVGLQQRIHSRSSRLLIPAITKIMYSVLLPEYQLLLPLFISCAETFDGLRNNTPHREDACFASNTPVNAVITRRLKEEQQQQQQYRQQHQKQQQPRRRTARKPTSPTASGGFFAICGALRRLTRRYR